MVLGPWTDIPGGVGVHLRVVQCRKRRTSPGLGNHQVMPIMLDSKGETQQKQSSGCSFRSMWQTMHLLNKAFTTKLWQPVLVIHLPPHPAHTPSISTLPTPRLILQPGPHCISSQAVKPGRGSGGGMLHPYQIPGPSKCESKTWSPSKCQVFSVSDTAEVVVARKAQGGTHTAGRLWQLTVKSVLLQHQGLQPSLDYQQSG